MFTQNTIDSMSVQDLIKTIKSLTHSIDTYIEDRPAQALDYCDNLSNIVDALRASLTEYLED